MKIWRAHVDSPNYSFEAYGKTASEAKANVTRGLSAHVQQTGASNDWLADALQDIIAEEFSIGRAYRDGVEIA